MKEGERSYGSRGEEEMLGCVDIEYIWLEGDWPTSRLLYQVTCLELGFCGGKVISLILKKALSKCVLEDRKIYKQNHGAVSKGIGYALQSPLLPWVISMSLCRPAARECEGCTPPNLPKGPLLATKWATNRVFIGGLQKWGSKSPLFVCPLF